MSTPIEILAAEGKHVKIPGETVHVREMAWTDTIAVLRQLSEFAGKFVRTDAQGRVRLDLNDLLGVISNSENIAGEIVARSTGKDRDWVGKQSPRAVLALLDVAIEVNLTDELKKLGKALGRRFGFGAAPEGTTTPNSAT